MGPTLVVPMLKFHRPAGTTAEVAFVRLAGSPPAGAAGGRVLVCLGGLGAAATAAFAPVLAHPAVAARGPSIVMDWLGSGWSDHDDAWGHTIEDHAGTVASLLDNLGLRDAVVAGHSLGGSVAIALASARPDLVGRLVVCEPNLDPGVGTFSAEIARWSEAEFAATGRKRMIDALHANAAHDPSAAELVRTVARWSADGLHRTAVSLLAQRTPTLREQLRALPMPRTFVASGECDEDLDAVAEVGCTVREVERAGHLMMNDDLDGFCSILAAAADQDGDDG